MFKAKPFLPERSRNRLQKHCTPLLLIPNVLASTGVASLPECWSELGGQGEEHRTETTTHVVSPLVPTHPIEFSSMTLITI